MEENEKMPKLFASIWKKKGIFWVKIEETEIVKRFASSSELINAIEFRNILLDKKQKYRLEFREE